MMDKFSHCRGVSDKIFQEPEKLHLTFGVLTLMDDVERKAAVDAFTSAMQDRSRLVYL